MAVDTFPGRWMDRVEGRLGNLEQYHPRELERRLAEIEDSKPEVVADRVEHLTTEVRDLKLAFRNLTYGVLGSGILVVVGAVLNGMLR